MCPLGYATKYLANNSDNLFNRIGERVALLTDQNKQCPIERHLTHIQTKWMDPLTCDDAFGRQRFTLPLNLQ